MKHNDIRLEALCYALHQVYTNHIYVTDGIGDSDSNWLQHMKDIVDEIEFRCNELLGCYTPTAYAEMHDSAKKAFYDPELVADIKTARDTEHFNMLRSIRNCMTKLWDTADGEDHNITISIDDHDFYFYNHAALVQGLSDALDYFESEL